MYDSAIQMRNVITDVATSVVEKLRPRPRYGIVQSIDRLNGKCLVIFTSEVEEIEISTGSLIPTYVGQKVQVGGVPGDRHITALFASRGNYFSVANSTNGVLLNTGTSGELLIDFYTNNVKSNTVSVSRAGDILFDGKKVPLFRERVDFSDTRTTNQEPSWYWTNYPRSRVSEFKQKATIGLSVAPGTYVSLETIVQGMDSSGGSIVQIATASGDAYMRYSISSTSWSAWTKFFMGPTSGVGTVGAAYDGGVKWQRVGGMVTMQFAVRRLAADYTAPAWDKSIVATGLPAAIDFRAAGQINMSQGVVHSNAHEYASAFFSPFVDASGTFCIEARWAPRTFISGSWFAGVVTYGV